MHSLSSDLLYPSTSCLVFARSVSVLCVCVGIFNHRLSAVEVTVMKSRIKIRAQNSPRFPRNIFTQISFCQFGKFGPISELLLFTLCGLDPNKDRNMCGKCQVYTQTVKTLCCRYLSPQSFLVIGPASHVPELPSLSWLVTNA